MFFSACARIEIGYRSLFIERSGCGMIARQLPLALEIAAMLSFAPLGVVGKLVEASPFMLQYVIPEEMSDSKMKRPSPWHICIGKTSDSWNDFKKIFLF